jgi:saccharopine dehydrogenase-like NADP-dependent oxidoreductase
MSTAVVFGSGRVARPALRTLLATGHRVVVATNLPDQAKGLLDPGDDAEVVEVDASNRASVRAAVARGDGVLSLLPPALHVRVAEACFSERRHFVSTSYASEEMRALDGVARRRELTFLNEIGADPGVDHMQVARAVRRIRDAGGRVRSLRSVCGGLPAPEAADNPLKYKISWTPRGVVISAGRPARYLQDDDVVPVGRFRIFDAPGRLTLDGLGEFESLPNGDSLRYLDEYGLGEPRTLFRGTLRWAGWCATWSALCRLGYADDAPDASLAGSTWAVEMWHAAGGREGESARQAAARVLGLPLDDTVLRHLDWLGLFADEPLPEGATSQADLLVHRMEQTMGYRPGERDMVALHHELEFEDAEGRPHRCRSHLVEYGDPEGDSAMARMVGLPAAFALHRILTGEIRERGVLLPVIPGVWEPVLADLEAAGLREQEEVEALA